MNSFMHSQIDNMLIMVQSFYKSCEMAAAADDGSVSREEAKQLKKIQKAVEHFTKELKSLQ